MSFDAKALCSWSCLRRLSSLSSALPSVTLLSVTLLIASPAPGWAQAAIYTPVGVATPTPSGKIVVTNAVCHDEDGSVSPDNVMWLDGNYVKSNTQIQAHTSATVSGVCEWTLFGVRYPQYDETRYISSVGFTDIHPAPQVGGYMTSMNYTPSQSLDTEIPGKSTQLSITNISTLGEHIFKFQTHALTTNCAIPSDSAFATRTVNAVACLPQWLKDQASNTLLPRGKFLTDAPIKIIYQDVSLGSTVQAVVDGWNSALAAAGLTAPQFQNAGNINCDNDLPHCIYESYREYRRAISVTQATAACA